MAQLFSGCRVAQARRKAIRTFKGRLRAFLSMFQHRRKQIRHERASTPTPDPTPAWARTRRKQIRHERASTLLACFPIKKGGIRGKGEGNHERGKPKRRGRRYASTGAAHCREWPIFAPGEFRLPLLMQRASI